VVLAEPAARAIKTAFPACHVWFVTRPEYGGLPELYGSVDSVAPCGGEQDYVELRRVATETGIDLVVDLQGNLRSRMIIRSLRATRTVRYRRQLVRRFLMVHVPRFWRGRLKHTLDLYAEALRPIGVDAAGLVPSIEPPSDKVAGASDRLGPGPMVAVCPGGSSPHKRWDEAGFAEVSSGLLSRGIKVVLVGSEIDREVVESVQDRVADRGLSLLVGDDIAMTAAALSLCGITVSNDSGLMHLAGAVGSDVVAVFGPTSPLLGFGPVARRSRVVSLNLACSPCSYHGNRPCRLSRRACLEDIDPDEVAAAVEDLMKRRGGDG
jgi:heptosyltransferase-2